jgi:TfoX/Sxy family transcriptional regulator of competence genes
MSGEKMATNIDFIEFVCGQIEGVGAVRYKKMFGEYMVYVNDKPLLLVCENTVYVKILPCLDELMTAAEKGFPYNGAKEHYILDIDDRELAFAVVSVLEPVTAVPKPKKKKSALNGDEKNEQRNNYFNIRG